MMQAYSRNDQFLSERAEHERLRAHANREITALYEVCATKDAEIERLKAGMREYACTGTDHPCGCYDQFLSERAEIERLQEENEALRAQLDHLVISNLMEGKS